MIPRRLRLSRQGFAARGLKRAASRHFSVSYTYKGEQGGTAVVISKKTERSAVKRHLLKRRIVAVIRQYAQEDQTLIVYARQGVGAVSPTLLRDELNSLVRSILPRT